MYANVDTYLGMYSIPESNLKKENYIIERSPEIITNSMNIVNSNSMNMVSSNSTNMADPKVWGPPFWFTLHVSAAHYPLEASPVVRERMKNRILAIPYEIPCAVCRPHAIDFVEKNRNNLDHIVSGRHSLGKFYVDFHNKVNERYGKPKWTYEQAYAKYS